MATGKKLILQNYPSEQSQADNARYVWAVGNCLRHTRKATNRQSQKIDILILRCSGKTRGLLWDKRYTYAGLLLECYGHWGGDLAPCYYELDGVGLIHLGAVEGLPLVIKWLDKHVVNPNQSNGTIGWGLHPCLPRYTWLLLCTCR